MKFVIKKSPKTGQFWFTIVASNGQALATSEQYTAKASAINAIESIQKGAAKAPVVEEGLSPIW
ncbi:MAG: DUF1508 domain-containing protein [Demequinaceae bacterium]|nr:DUF1508 domain-containing protein [Demequinaceae bacterium]